MILKYFFPSFCVVQALNPLHAKNLDETLKEINIEKSLIISVDACLGKREDMGKIAVKLGSISPGAGGGKDLPMLGDVSIFGIVNVEGFMDFLVLQNTRLGTVYKMVEITAKALINALCRKDYKIIEVCESANW